MSRYYDITLSAPPSSTNSSQQIIQEWTSHPSSTPGQIGNFNPGALNVQLDLLATVSGLPASADVGNSTITIEGVPLSNLLQATQYVGMQISVKGGMQAGLPLANPAQAGLMLQGAVQQSFGNWQGVDQNLNMVVVPSGPTYHNPGNFTFNWLPGQSLQFALQNCLEIAYPNALVFVQIGNQYATNYQVLHVVSTLKQLAAFINSLTRSAAPTQFGIVMKVLPTGAISVTDFSTTPAVKQLVFTDLIGQPQWVDANKMQFQTVMRADLQIGSLVQMPIGLQNLPGVVTTGVASQSTLQLKYTTSFQGSFLIQAVRHVGNFRDADGTSWISIFQAAPMIPGVPVSVP